MDFRIYVEPVQFVVDNETSIKFEQLFFSAIYSLPLHKNKVDWDNF